MFADFPSRLKDPPLLKREAKVSKGEMKDAFSGSMSLIEQARAPQLTWVGVVAKAGGVISPSVRVRSAELQCASEAVILVHVH